MKKFILSLGVVGLAAGLIAAPAAYAGDSKSAETEVEVTVDDSLLISTSGKVAISALPTGAGAQFTGDDIVKVSTNDIAGYTLEIQDKDADFTLASSTTATPIAASAGTIASSIALATDTWGFRTSTLAANTFAGITGSAQELKATVGPATDDTTVVTYGVNVTTTTANGVYTDVVVYTATNNT
jgi:hypothetical protein